MVGDPREYAKRYYEQGADELIYMDIVASLYGRSNLVDIVRHTAHDVFIPMTVGGGIRSIEDVTNLLNAGADKVAINTAAVKRPELISEIAKRFGSQCITLSVEAKKQDNNCWEVYTDCGREKSNINVLDWVRRGIDMGAGEVLLTSIDQEGTRKGFDLGLLEAVEKISSVPIILSGGYGEPGHLQDAINFGADAVAFADVLHYERANILDLKNIASEMNVIIRTT